MKFLDNLNSKKFLFGILLVVLSFVFVLVGKMSATDWITFVGVVGGMYVVINVATQDNTKN